MRLLQDPGDSSRLEPGFALQKPGAWEDAAMCSMAIFPSSLPPGGVVKS